MADYSQMTDNEFYDILQELCGSDLTVPGAYEVYSEHYNNQVLDTWAERNREKAYPIRYVCVACGVWSEHQISTCPACGGGDFDEEHEEED